MKKKLNKKHIGLLCTSILHSSLFATIDGPLVQENEGNLQINDLFNETLVNDLHYLIKRSYRLTHRDTDAYDYTVPHKLITDRYSNFEYRNSERHKWFMLKPFSGIHGSNGLAGGIGIFPNTNGVEGDYPGFVALLQRKNIPPIIAIVFRGSQSSSFEPLNGILGPSWLTNFSARKMECPPSINLDKALFHKGFLEKYLSTRLNIISNIINLWKKIPKNQREQTRFIITGHSQGAALTIPAALDLTKNFLPKLFKREFSNIETPRLFVYALSGPNVVGNQETKDMINKIVGRDNIIRHSSVFDIVTYICLGKHYDYWLYNFLLKTIAGVEAGYLPVGRLAIDDTLHLISKGLYYNNELELLDYTDEIVSHCKKFYNDAVLAYRNEHTFLKMFYKGIAAWHLSHGLSEIGGIKNFICINHYGSTTANDIFLKKDKEASSISTSFDPRLPECNLESCLRRGDMHRNVTLKLVDYESPDQVFIPEISSYDSIDLEGYESEEA